MQLSNAPQLQIQLTVVVYRTDFEHLLLSALVCDVCKKASPSLLYAIAPALLLDMTTWGVTKYPDRMTLFILTNRRVKALLASR